MFLKEIIRNNRINICKLLWMVDIRPDRYQNINFRDYFFTIKWNSHTSHQIKILGHI